MTDPSYWRTYRRDHPEYRAREAERTRARRQARTAAGLPTKPDHWKKWRPPAPAVPAATFHPILVIAQAVARQFARPDHRATLWDDLYDDLVATAALAILDARDPVAACRRLASQVRQDQVLTVCLAT